MSESSNLYILPAGEPFNIHAFHRGEQSAVRSVFDRLYKPLVFFARGLAKTADADDIVSAAFVKMYNRRRELASFDHIKRSLYVSVRNACIDHLRRQQKEKSFTRDFSYTADEAEQSADLELMKAALLQELFEEIEKLPGQRKKILKLYFFGEMNTAEIAQKLGLSEQTVRNQKINALESLRHTIIRPDWLLPAISATMLYAIQHWI